MAGQTMTDRLLAARHSIAGQGLAKSVCKATTEELIGPKKKHLDCKYIFNACNNIKLICILSCFLMVRVLIIFDLIITLFSK